jgi:hypothetical protein
MKGNPALLGGSLKSKPTWLGTFGCLATSALFLRSSAMIAGAIGWIVLGLIAGYVAARWQTGAARDSRLMFSSASGVH